MRRLRDPDQGIDGGPTITNVSPMRSRRFDAATPSGPTATRPLRTSNAKPVAAAKSLVRLPALNHSGAPVVSITCALLMNAAPLTVIPLGLAKLELAD